MKSLFALIFLCLPLLGHAEPASSSSPSPLAANANGTQPSAGPLLAPKGFASALEESVRWSWVRTTDAAQSVSGIVSEALGATATGAVSLAGAATQSLLSSAGTTVSHAVHTADSVGLMVAGTVTQAAKAISFVPEKVAGMLDYATSLIGTPYRWGGTSVDTGLDCSGFVREVVQAEIGTLLPRTAREMSRVGTQVARSELKPGDLVFFNTRRRPFSHVGIYLGDGKFVHGASGRASGRQVRVDNLANNYFSSRYNGARRIDGLDAPPPEALLLN